MKKLVLFAAVAAAAAVFPTGALAASFSGVVVGKGPGSLAVANRSGVVQTVRTARHARVGARVRVNGSAVRIVGTARHARIHAVVVRRVGGTIFLAAGRSLLSLRAAPRAFASATQSTPMTGSVVNASVGIAGGQLTQGTTQVVGQAGSVTIQATVTGVAPGSITLSVNGQPLTIALPVGIQLPASTVGQSVTLNLNLAGANPTAKPGDDEDDDDQGEDEDDDHGDHHDDGNDDHDD